jgi:predicted acylesterase/phospholipase RssA
MDGGVISNLPIEVASKKRVLAVSIINQKKERQLKKKGRLIPKNTILGLNYTILLKTMRMLILQNEARSMIATKKDITYLGAPHNFGIFDFDRSGEMIAFGYEETKKILG